MRFMIDKPVPMNIVGGVSCRETAVLYVQASINQARRQGNRKRKVVVRLSQEVEPGRRKHVTYLKKLWGLPEDAITLSRDRMKVTFRRRGVDPFVIHTILGVIRGTRNVRKHDLLTDSAETVKARLRGRDFDDRWVLHAPWTSLRYMFPRRTWADL